MIPVAHRLRTIIDYDKVLVLDHGDVKEYAHPHQLLQNSNGIFYSLVAQSGEPDGLRQLAKEAYELENC